MTTCQSAVGCVHPAAISVSLLVPSGETIESDTGSVLVLKPAASKLLCVACATEDASDLMAVLGCHLDSDLVDHEPEQADPITAAKAEEDRMAIAAARSGPDAFRLEAYRSRHRIIPVTVDGSTFCLVDGIRLLATARRWWHDIDEARRLASIVPITWPLRRTAR